MIRRATSDELPYCRATWITSMLRGRRAFGASRTKLAHNIELLLESQPVLVGAYPGEDPATRPEDIAGWICYTPLASSAVLHWIYVRDQFRGAGIGRALVEAAGIDITRTVLYTQHTKAAAKLMRQTGARGKSIAVKDVLP